MIYFLDSNRTTNIGRLVWACLIAVTTQIAQAATPPDVLEAETQRVAVIAQIAQQTVAIFDSVGQGGGSGVLISSDGYALTNFHVTASCGAAMKCGLADGKLYDAVLVGLDPPGDVALIKLLGRSDFPAAELGDSDAASVGDWVFVLGNPFLLAEDFRPTVTYGILSGTHRYQYPAGTLLEYADCLQTDASINPGNSGGPLFDAKGQLIGINGRGSFEKRGRVNVGVGYAISINQIKRFLSHLKAGRVVDHPPLAATVTSPFCGRVAVDELLEGSDAYRRGLRYGDQLLAFGGRDIHSANALKNALGTYPSGWRVPLEYRREQDSFRANVRLTSLHAAGELESLIEDQAKNPTPIEPPGPKEDEQKEPKPAPIAKKKPELPKVVKRVYEKRSGFANYWFNRQHQQLLAESCRQFSSLAAETRLSLDATDGQGMTIRLVCDAAGGDYRSVQGHFMARFDGAYDHEVGPPGSGGLLAAAEEWRRLLAQGLDGFGEAYYFGHLPFGDDLQLHDCLVTTDRGVKTHFYFAHATGDLVGMELFTADDRDPCEIRFSDFEPWEGGVLPFAWQVKYGDEIYVEFKIDRYHQEQVSAEASDD
ncbi:MAG: S1C family serine protease [Aeoliella sp.]